LIVLTGLNCARGLAPDRGRNTEDLLQTPCCAGVPAQLCLAPALALGQHSRLLVFAGAPRMACGLTWNGWQQLPFAVIALFVGSLCRRIARAPRANAAGRGFLPFALTAPDLTVQSFFFRRSCRFIGDDGGQNIPGYCGAWN